MFLTLLETLATTAFQTMAVVKNQVEVALPMKAYLVNMKLFSLITAQYRRKSKLLTKHQGT
jgi:hypothetical protein